MNQLHFIVTEFVDYYALEGIEKALKEFGCTPAILSMVDMHKEVCITKEKFEEMYKTEEESETRMDLSVGEDLENFIERIKNGEINKDTIQEDGDFTFKRSFLLCLLDNEERKKLEQKNEDFIETFNLYGYIRLDGNIGLEREADVPEAEWNASESNLKFSKSICSRETHFVDA